MLSFDSPVAVNGHDATSMTPALATATKSSLVNLQKSSQMSLSANLPASPGTSKHHHIWLVTGPAGCGKTTVAEHIAAELDLPYLEGDSYHTTSNVQKMRSGIPLTDADRWDWLTQLRDVSTKCVTDGAAGVVVTCSALKRKYRDVIRVAAYYNHNILIHFMFLDAPQEILLKRVAARKGHYMGANMVQSQFEILERPAQDESDVIRIDVSLTMEEVKQVVLAQVRNVMEQDKADTA